MIRGVGIDIVSISRMEKLIAARGERFLRKVFSEEEIGEGTGRLMNAAFFAARFAAREAFVKALGTGFRQGISVADVAVKRGIQGKPELAFSRKTEEMLAAQGIAACHVSITHEGDIAQAVVIIESA